MTVKNKHLSLAVSILLFALAAVVTASLLSGALTSSSGNSFLAFGTMLVSVYGLSSLFIPGFLVVAGIFCLDKRWSLQRIVCLAISIIPFFTITATEHNIRRIAVEDVSPIAITKIVILVAIAILLVAMEYLVAMVLATSSFKKDILPRLRDYKDEAFTQVTMLWQKVRKNRAANIAPFADEGVEVVDETPELHPAEAEYFAQDENYEPQTTMEREIEVSVEHHIDEAVEGLFAPAQEYGDEEVLSEEAVEEQPVEEAADDGGPEERNVFAASLAVTEELDFIDEDDIPEEEPVAEEVVDEYESEPDFAVQDEADMAFAEQEAEPVECDDGEIVEEAIPAEEALSEEEESVSADVVAEEMPQEQAVMPSVTDIFARMDEDAEAQMSQDEDDYAFDPTAAPVVDSHGRLNDRQIEDNLTLDEDVYDTEDDDDDEAMSDDYEDSGVPIISSARAVTADGTPVPLPVHRKVCHGPYEIPTDLLTAYEDNPYWIIDEETEQAGESLKATLNEFGIQAEVTGIVKGPVVTMFELLPAPGVKLSKIVALQDNIALRLAASSVRIVAPIPGKKAVGIEIPNQNRAIVSFRECIEQDRPEWKKMAVPVVLGKDIQGNTQIIDLVKTPHLLIAGSTGAGKSVCVNSMILSMLYKRSPDQVKMILIDPKIVELKLYNDIPHLLTPVITEPKKAMQALQYCLCEMERRYALLDGMGVRDISSYNRRIVERQIATESLPYLIVVIDEFADLMATTGKQLETVLARLAAMSRAVGIHLVLATQRPSIDVITGLIKANIPSRIAFMVASKTDSRIIIDQMGAEKLLGKGDMLYASSTDPFPIRMQGTFVSDQEVEDVVAAVKQWGEPEYIDDEIFVPDDDDDDDGQMALLGEGGEDPLYEKALDIVVQAGKASASYIQRRLKIGYNRAARLVEEMEERGIVGPANGSKPRELIHTP